VVAGQRQPMEVHLAAHAINTALESTGNTVTLLPAVETSKADLSNLDASASDTLVILGGNPAYNLKLGAEIKIHHSGSVWATTRRDGESSELEFSGGALSESWGDATTSDGFDWFPIQPLIQPLFGGLNELEFLARLAGESQTARHEIVQSTFGSSEASWKKFLYNGYTPVSQSPITGVPVTETPRSLVTSWARKRPRFPRPIWKWFSP